MLDTATEHQRQIWAAQRLYRICKTLRNGSADEPCLEQYEKEVQLLTGEELTPAVGAWISLIAEALRSDVPFEAGAYVSCG